MQRTTAWSVFFLVFVGCGAAETAAPDASVSRYSKPVAILYLGASATLSPAEYFSLLISSMPRATRIEANAAFVVTPARSLREHLSDSNTAALLDRDLDVVFLEESIAMLAQGDPTLNADVSAIAARVHAQRPCARIVVVAPHAGNVTLHAQIVERTRGAAEDVGGLWLPLIEVTNELGTVTAELSTYSLAAAMFRVITQTSAPNASVNTISQADAARVRSAIETVWSRAPNPNFDFAHGAARAPYWCSLACNTLPNVRMLSADLNTCTSATPSPQSGETYFSSTCGCGYFR